MSKKSKNKRRKILALLVSAALIVTGMAACGSSSDTSSSSSASGKLTKFNIGHLPATGHILYFIAYEEGFFKDEGLDVTLTQYNNNTEELAALEAGKLDVAPINATNLIKYIGEGHEVTSIGGVMSDGHALVVDPSVVKGLKEKDYHKNLKLLKGKTIVLQANSTYDVEFRIALKEAGLDLDKDVNIVTADSGTDAYNALKSKDVDAAAVYAPFRQKAIDEGYVPLIYCDEIDYFDHPICCRDVALSKKVKENPETYEAFTRAMIRAGEFLENDHEGSIKDALKYLDIDKDILTKDIYNHSINNPDPDEAKTVTLYKAMKELGYIDKDFDVTKSVNNDIYVSALDSLIKENPDNKYYKSLKKYHKTAVYKK